MTTTTYTIQGQDIFSISSMFIAYINEPGVKDLGDPFFAVHDCIHWFTGLRVSVEEERIIGEIQMYMLGSNTKTLSEKARFYIIRLMAKGVYTELKDALVESRAQMFAGVL